jgi:hypothetical protein
MANNYDLQVDIARGIFLSHDQERLIRKYALEADENHIFLSYLGTPCRICRKTAAVEEFTDGAWRECRSFNTVMTIYDLLCFHTGDYAPTLSGQWCTVGTFVVTGVTKTEGFTGKFANRFNGHTQELREACSVLGGELLPRMAGADVTCRFPVTPFFPVLLQFWEGDEEFPAKFLVLWDRSTDRFLHFETTFYLQGDLLTRLEKACNFLTE